VARSVDGPAAGMTSGANHPMPPGLRGNPLWPTGPRLGTLAVTFRRAHPRKAGSLM